jgi:hypothetical protein
MQIVQRKCLFGVCLGQIKKNGYLKGDPFHWTNADDVLLKRSWTAQNIRTVAPGWGVIGKVTTVFQIIFSPDFLPKVQIVFH